MSEFDAVAYLASKGLEGKQGAGAEVAYPCWLDCQENPQSRKRKLYVNTDEGFYICFVCGAYGGTYLLQKSFGDEPHSRPAEDADPTSRLQILDWATDVGAAMLANNDDVMWYLVGERGLSAETVLERRLGWIGGHRSLVGSLPEQFSRKQLEGTGLIFRDGPKAGQDFFYNHLLIPYMSRGKVVSIRGRVWGDSKSAKYLSGPGEGVRLYNVDSLEEADDVVITEGELDAAVLAQCLAEAANERARKMAVIGLPGTQAKPNSFETYLSQAKRIYIALDPDSPGRREAVKLKDQFGARARIVELPTQLPKCDWTNFLLPVPANADPAWLTVHPHAGHNWRDVLRLLGNARGKRLFSMAEAGASYRHRRDTLFGGAIKTGIHLLDATIEPGILPGQVVVVLAKTGAGKSVFLCNLAYYMRHHRIMFLSLELTREEVYAILSKIYRFWSPWATDDEIDQGLASVWLNDENRLAEGDLAHLIGEYEVETGERPDAVFVDYLGYYARGAKGNSHYEKVTNAIMQLKAEAKSNQVAIFTPAQVNRLAKEGKPIDLDDARDAGTIEETADFLLALWRPDDALDAENVNREKSGAVMMSLLKTRHGGKGTTFNLMMDTLTLAMVDDGHPQEKARAEKNTWRRLAGLTYEQLREEQLRPVQRRF